MQNRLSPFIKANQLIKYIYTTTQSNSKKITISSAFYGVITAFLKEIASKIDFNTSIIINNGNISAIIDGGILRIDVSEFFNNNSWMLVNPKFYLTMLNQIRGHARVSIIQNGLDTIVYNFDDKEIHQIAIITKNIQLPICKIINPKQGVLKSSTEISYSEIITLKEAKKLFNAQCYIITIDKNTFELLAISIRSKNTNIQDFSKVFNQKYFLKENSESFASYKVRDLFPVIENTSPTNKINIYFNETLVKIKTTSEWILDTNYYSNAVETNYIPFNSKNKNNTPTLNTFKFTTHTKDTSFKERLFKFIDSLKLIKINSNEKIKMYSYILDKSEEVKALIVYANDKYIAEVQDKGNIFFTLKITQKYDYTFSFDGLSELVEFDTPNNMSGEKKDIAYANKMLYSDELLINQRISILKQCLQFVKEEGLYQDTKIKSIGLSKSFKEVDRYNKYRLIKFNTDKKNGTYSSYVMEQSTNLYTSKINYYKAYIKYPQDIVDNFKQLTSEQAIKKLKTIIGNKFKKCEEIIVQKDSTGRYSIKVNVKCSKQFNKPIEISERNHLVFKLDIDNKSVFYKISHTSKYSTGHNLYRTKKVLTDLQANKIDDEEVESIKAELILLEDYEQKIEEYKKSLYDLRRVKTDPIEYMNRVNNVKHLSYAMKYYLKISNQIWKKYYSDYKNPSDNEVLSTNIDNYIDDILYTSRKEMPTLSFKAKNALINESTKISVNPTLCEDKKYFVKNIHEKQVKVESFKLAVKEQMTYSFQVNRWDTTHKDILQKYSHVKKHYFTLADDIEDIVKQIINFTSKYTLLEITDVVLFEKVEDISSNNFKTKKKFQDMVINNPSTKKLMSIDEDNLSDYLHQLLSK